MSTQPKRIYQFGPFRIDAEKRVLLREGEAVPLAPKAFDTLLVLVEHHGEVLEKVELMEMLWPDSEVEEANLPQNISALRKALGESPNERRYIITIPGRGYRFAADVKEADDDTSDVIAGRYTRSTIVIQEQGRGQGLGQKLKGLLPVFASSTARQKLVFVGIALAIVVIGVTALYYLWSASISTVSTAPDISTPIHSTTPVRSIAVLPFKLLGAEESGSEMEYLSDGISESLINSLSQLDGLKVTARSSSFKYKGQDTEPEEVARALGVQAILTGRVLQRGGELQISVELMDARDKTQMWGEQYNRKATDLLQVQSEISREIAERLRARLTAGERQQLAKRETVNPQAYELVLKGRFYWNKGKTESRKKAIEYYQQAIAVDPTYALAYAELARAYSTFGYRGIIDPKEAMPKAKAAAMRALEIDDTLAEAHAWLAYIEQCAWDGTRAEQEYKRAQELNPNYAEAHGLYAVYLSQMQRHEQAIAEAKRAKELDPLSPSVNISYFYTLWSARQYDQAIDHLKQMLELDQNIPIAHVLLGYIYAAKEQYQEAIAEYKEAMKLGIDNTSVRIHLGYAYALAGQREQAQAILSELQRTKEYVSPTELAILYVGLGKNEQAFRSLERAYSAHDLQLIYLGIDPHFDPLRSDPRFQEFVGRVGLPQ